MNLVKYDAACRALAAAKSVDEVKLIRDKAQAIAAAAKIAKNHELEIDAAEIRIRAERRLGEMIAAQREAGLMAKGRLRRGSDMDPREDKPTLAESGIDKHLADRARKTAAIPGADFEATLAEHREAQRAVTSSTIQKLSELGKQSKAHVSHNSGDNEWYTPRKYCVAAKTVMGGIDLDPASTKTSNDVVGADKFFTRADDGLRHQWRGRIWMNPPYASDLIGKFVHHFVGEWKARRIKAGMVLVNNATETRWFSELASNASAICFPSGRIRFWGPNKTTAAPLQGQAILFFGKNVTKFVKTFKRFGFVVLLAK